MANNRLIEKIFLDKQGKLCLAQRPNLPLATWIGATILTKLLPTGRIDSLFSVVAYGALFTWAWLEMFQGTNYFRRGLGALVLTVIILSRI